eukprot:817162-Pleurochrysis_carterae.AAC.1
MAHKCMRRNRRKRALSSCARAGKGGRTVAAAVCKPRVEAFWSQAARHLAHANPVLCREGAALDLAQIDVHAALVGVDAAAARYHLDVVEITAGEQLRTRWAADGRMRKKVGCGGAGVCEQRACLSHRRGRVSRGPLEAAAEHL